MGGSNNEKRRREAEQKASKRKRQTDPAMTPHKASGASRPFTGFFHWVTTFWGGVVVVATLLGLLLAWFELGPKIQFEPDVPLDPSDVFTTPFKIANQGLLPLRSVQCRCIMNYVRLPWGTLWGEREHDTLIDLGVLGPGETVTGSCQQGPDPRFEKADISIRVRYQPAYCWWRGEKLERFVTAIDSAGKMRWVHEPASEVHFQNKK